MSAIFKFLHLSDLHFAVGPNRLPSPIQTNGLTALFKGAITGYRGNWFKPASHSTRAARAIARYLITKIVPEEAPDLVVISGDLAATGDNQDLSSARAYLTGSAKDWVNSDEEPQVSFGEAKLLILPGNHDRYHAGTLSPGSNNFEKIFTGFWHACPGSARVSEPLLVEKNGEALALICADFTFKNIADSLPSVTGYIGRGEVYQDVLAELVNQTVLIRDKIVGRVAVIWVVHYPPQYPNVDPNLRLHNEEKLLLAAAEANVKILLAGHTHIDRIYSVNGITISCAGTATQAEADSPWHFSLNEIVVDKGVVVGGNIIPFRYKKAGRNNFSREPAVELEL